MRRLHLTQFLKLFCENSKLHWVHIPQWLEPDSGRLLQRGLVMSSPGCYAPPAPPARTGLGLCAPCALCPDRQAGRAAPCLTLQRKTKTVAPETKQNVESKFQTIYEFLEIYIIYEVHICNRRNTNVITLCEARARGYHKLTQQFCAPDCAAASGYSSLPCD